MVLVTVPDDLQSVQTLTALLQQLLQHGRTPCSQSAVGRPTQLEQTLPFGRIESSSVSTQAPSGGVKSAASGLSARPPPLSGWAKSSLDDLGRGRERLVDLPCVASSSSELGLCACVCLCGTRTQKRLSGADVCVRLWAAPRALAPGVRRGEVCRVEGPLRRGWAGTLSPAMPLCVLLSAPSQRAHSSLSARGLLRLPGPALGLVDGGVAVQCVPSA